jgi:hypothetical protein
MVLSARHDFLHFVYGRFLIAEEDFMGSRTLTKIKIHPTGMRLHEWICLEEGFFEQQGLDVEVLWSVKRQRGRTFCCLLSSIIAAAGRANVARAQLLTWRVIDAV